MVGRQPELAGKGLSDQALLQRVKGVKAELIRRAKER